MREYGLDEKLIRAAASHGYGLCEGELPEPEHQMEKYYLQLMNLQD